MIHLDTTILVDLLRESRATRASRESEGVAGEDPVDAGPAHRFLQRHADQEMGVSVYVACELLAGAECARDPDVERETVGTLLRGVTVLFPDARYPPMYAELYAELRKRGERVPAFDLLIGTAARVDDVPLVTRNTSDFERIPGLRVLSY